MFNKQDAEKVERELRDIERSAGYCPDPDGGGCIGTHCTLCAVGELRAVLKKYIQPPASANDCTCPPGNVSHVKPCPHWVLPL